MSLSSSAKPSDTENKPAESSATNSNWSLLKRMLALAWRYRWGCIELLLLQFVLLGTALVSVDLGGYGVDLVRFHMGELPQLPVTRFGWVPPSHWSRMTQVTAVAALVLVIALFRTWLNYLYAIESGKLVHERIVVDLRSRVYDQLQRLSFRFFDANASGSLINRVTGDVQAVRAFIDAVLIQFIVLVVSLVCYLVYMLSIHVWLTIACLAPTPLLWWSTNVFSRRVRPQYDRNRDLVDKLILTLSENIQGVHVVKGFGREPEETAKFHVANQAVQDQQRDIFWRVSVFAPLIATIGQLSLFVLLAYGGYLTIHGELSIGTGLVVFTGLLHQFSSQVSNLSGIANTVQQSLSGARRVFEILDTPVEITSPRDAVRMPRCQGDVSFESVSFEYKPGSPVLREISFHAKPGSCVAILGATGAGKSTLLSLIARFYDPTSGRVLIDGHDVRQLHLDDLRRSIGIVFQESFLFSNTIAANIAFGNPNTTREEIQAAAEVAAAAEFIDPLPDGYDTLLGEYGLNLSGGQRQRLAIARAVLLNPPILILDDPAASIDPHTEQEILAAMGQAMKGRTTFIVAHRLSTLRHADVVIVLEEGRVSQIGSHEELMCQSGHYREVLEAQVGDFRASTSITSPSQG